MACWRIGNDQLVVVVTQSKRLRDATMLSGNAGPPVLSHFRSVFTWTLIFDASILSEMGRAARSRFTSLVLILCALSLPVSMTALIPIRFPKRSPYAA